MHVHAGTVVANDRLRHEGRGLAIGVRDIPDHVLQVLCPVSTLDQCRELGADFILAGAGNFMVMHFNRNAERFEDQAHFGTHVLETIDRRDREIAAFDCGTMTCVATLELFAGGPRCFLGTDTDETSIHADFPANTVENEKLWLRTEVRSVTHAGRLQIRFSALRDRPWVAVITFAVGRFDHIALHEHRRFFHERIDACGVRIRHQEHVGCFNAFPARDRRAVECMAGLELVDIKMRNRHGHVLFLASCISKAKIDEFDFVFLHHL